MTPTEATDYLYALPRFAGTVGEGEMGLDRIRVLLEALGDPQRAFKSAHIAGTNGKGSTASMLAAVATASGLRTGLHTSPHLFDLTERMRVDGTPASRGWLVDALTHHRKAFDAVQPSFFEATVALSFLFFAERAVDLAVVEVGLGGRLDATNILTPELALITRVTRDHTHLLGDTLPAIAREKGGIIKPNTPVLVGKNSSAAVAVLRQIAADRAAPFHFVPDEVTVRAERADLRGTTLSVRTPLHAYEDLQIGLAGAHQQDNALLALRAAEELFGPGPEATEQGLRQVHRLAGLRGRLEVLHQHPLVLYDVAHNPDGMAAALQTVRPLLPPAARLYVLLSLMRDKDLAGIADVLARTDAVVLPAALPSARALPPHALADELAAAGLAVLPSASPAEQLACFRRCADPHDVLLAAGSHQLAAHFPPPYTSHRPTSRA